MRPRLLNHLQHLQSIGAAVLLGLGLHVTPAGAMTVANSRPRLLVRADDATIGRGPTVSELRARVSRSELAPYAKLVASDATWEGILTPALQTLLGGEASTAAQVRGWLLEQTSGPKHSVARQGPGHMAIAFDWLHDSLPAADRRTIAENIRTGADVALAFLHVGEPDITHNFTYMALFSVTMAGLALHGEPGFEAVSQAYLDEAHDWLESAGGVYDACMALGGAFPEGGQYAFTESTRLLVLTLHGLRTATDVDPFTTIRDQHGDFLRGTGRFYMAMTRPDMTVERIGDMNQFKPLLRDQHRFVIEALAAGLRGDGGDASVPAMLEHFSDLVHEAYGWRDTHRNLAWGMVVFADPDAPRDRAAYASQPLLQVFGRGTLDFVVLRHGWDEDGTMLTFQAGDHFADHQHFDKGAFTIYHHGALAIDSGAYDRMYSAHHCQYASRTVAHNAPLVFDPQQPVPTDYRPDGGQRVLRGFQHHARWTDFLAHRQSEHLDAADLLAAESGDAMSLTATTAVAPFAGFAVAQAELAGAYGPAVRSLRRTLAYWPAAGVVLVDDAFQLSAPLDVAFLLHTQDTIVPTASASDTTGLGNAPGVARLGSVDWWVTSRHGSVDLGEREVHYDGRLFLRTLAPTMASAQRIGGKGYQWWVRGTQFGPAGNGAAPRESGNWRVEVHPRTPAAATHMTHVMFIGDPAAYRIPEAAMLTGTRGWRVAQVASAPEALLAIADGGAGALPLHYDVTTALPSVHLVLGLAPGTRVTVQAGGTTNVVQASEAGLLAFVDPEVGSHAVEITAARVP